MAGTTVDSRRCVVVFDDDVRFIRLVERVLSCEGIRAEPITTDNLDAGLKIVEAHSPLMVLVDIFMYDAARGFDFIERLKAHPATRTIPIIVASGADRELRRSAAWLDELGCDVLLKPFPADELIDLVLRAPLRRQRGMINGNGYPRRPAEPADRSRTLIRWPINILERARHMKDGARRPLAP